MSRLLTTAPECERRPLRALVVDDEATVRGAVARALRSVNIVCDVATDGAQALELLEDGDYDLVVTDLRMPHAHGHTLAANLTALPDRPTVVVLTGIAEPRLEKDLKERGVDGVFYKPVDLPEFANCVKQLALDRMSVQAAELELDDRAALAQLESHAPAATPSTDDFSRKLESLVAELPSSPAWREFLEPNGAGRIPITEFIAAAQKDAGIGWALLRLVAGTLQEPTVRALELQRQIVAINQTTMHRLTDLRMAVAFVAGLTAGWLLCWFGIGLR